MGPPVKLEDGAAILSNVGVEIPMNAPLQNGPESVVEIGGVRYSHIVDPRTGLGLTGRRSATVIAPTGIQADSLTKAVMLMPVGKGFELVETIPGAAAYTATVGRDETVVTAQTKRFAGYAAPELPPGK